MTDHEPVLEGIRVCDLTIVWAGPAATQYLADLGAEVIRVEDPYRFPVSTKGVVPRPTQEMLKTLSPAVGSYAPPVGDRPDRPYNRNAANNAVTRNKLSFTVDTRRPEGVEIVLRLIEQCDLLVENFAARRLGAMGLEPARLLARNPRLVILRLPPAGLTGDWSHYTGFGQQFDALCGLTSLWGHPDLDATENIPTTYMDGATGPVAAFAALAALRYRDETGRGQVVELSQTENMMQHMGEIYLDYSMNGVSQTSLGNRHPSRAPQGVYPCSGTEKWLAISIGSDAEWHAMALLISGETLVEDPRFATVEARCEHHDELDRIIERWSIDQDVMEAFHALQAVGVPAGPVMDEAMMFADDHLKARSFFRSLESRDVGTHLYPGPPFRGLPVVWRRGAPALGEDNEYVYRHVLGMSDEEYGRVVASGMVLEDYVDNDGNPL